MRNYYKVLGIPESATDSEIKKAYRKLAALYHPDHNPHDPLAMHEMKIINQAYDVLSDPDKRTHYDSINGFPGTPLGTQSNSSSDDTMPEPQYDKLPISSPVPEHNPFAVSGDQIPKHPENIANVLCLMQDQNRNGITPCMRNVLWIDLFVSISYLIYYFIMKSHLPTMPPGLNLSYVISVRAGGAAIDWMVRFKLAAYLELASSAIAIYWMRRTERSNFIKYYLFIKGNFFISVAAAYFGLTTINTSMFIPSMVSLWKLYLIFSLLLSRLEQVIWRVGKQAE